MADNKVFVGNIPCYIEEATLKEKFETHGSILDFFYMRDMIGSDRGWATITYSSTDQAAMAVKFSSTPITDATRTVFELRPAKQRKLTPWQETEVAEGEEHAGSTYYYNPLTEETAWERPPELDQFVENPAGANVIPEEIEMAEAKIFDHTGVLKSEAPAGCNIVVRANFENITTEMVKARFDNYKAAGLGAVLACKIAPLHADNAPDAVNPLVGAVTSLSDTYALVGFSTPDAAIAALREMDGVDLFHKGDRCQAFLKPGEEFQNPVGSKLGTRERAAGSKAAEAKGPLMLTG